MSAHTSTYAESEEQAWWEECLGMEGGALFMKRFMETQMYSNYRHSDAARCVSFETISVSCQSPSVPIPPPHTTTIASAA